jgi:hypothetical protein
MVLTKILRNSIFLFVAFVLIITSCKKYPDGPLLSLQSKTKRIVGIWDVEYFEINGFDSTAYLKSKSFYGMYSFEINPSHGSADYADYRSDDARYNNWGSWAWKSDKDDLGIYLPPTPYTNSLGPYRAEYVIWEIRRLTKNQLWLRTTYTDGRTYLVKFKLYRDL